MTVTGDVQGVFLTAARAVGLTNPAMMTPTQFANWLRRGCTSCRSRRAVLPANLRRHDHAFSTSGDAVMAIPGWPGMIELAAQAGKKTLRSSIPREGGWSAANGYSITTAAQNVPTAYAYINEVLKPSVAASVATSLTGGVSVAGAVPLLSASLPEHVRIPGLEGVVRGKSSHVRQLPNDVIAVRDDCPGQRGLGKDRS